MKHPEPLHKIETASLKELQALQLERLQWSLRHCYKNIPYYRQSFDEKGVQPEDLKTLSDLKNFPFTLKADLRKNYPTGMFAVPMKKIIRLHASSGTTGKPTVVGYTRKDIEVWSTCMARSIRAAGGDENSIIHVSYGYGLFTGGLGAHFGGEKLGATVIPVSGGMTERQVQLIDDLKPTVIMVTPSYFLNLIKAAEKLGVDPKQWSLDVAILGAEPWSEGMREIIEAQTRTQATNIYGLSEIMGPGVAQECIETKDGLTIWEDHFYPEIIDPKTLEILPEGSSGELVFTTLTKEGTPLIRYRTRDISRLLPGTARIMRRMERIAGRTDDMMIIRGVNVFPSQIEEQILKIPELAPNYQLELSKTESMTKMIVHVDLSEVHYDEMAVSNRLQELVKSFIGISVDVTINPPNTLPESQGKAIRILKN